MTETGNTPSTGTVFAAEGLSKSFGGTTVLDRVSLELRAGRDPGRRRPERLGKSTLVKLMSGYHQPDAGEITVGERESFRFVHQNLGLISNLSVVDNLALELGYQTAGQELAPIHWRRERARARDLLLGVGLEIDPEQLVEELTVGERALVALARALGAWSEDSRVLVLDEPTVSLSQTDTLRLFNAVRSLTEGGIGVLCVLHSVHEVLEFADRVLVLRIGSSSPCWRPRESTTTASWKPSSARRCRIRTRAAGILRPDAALHQRPFRRQPSRLQPQRQRG